LPTAGPETKKKKKKKTNKQKTKNKKKTSQNVIVLYIDLMCKPQDVAQEEEVRM
jgi:hypothetical protein